VSTPVDSLSVWLMRHDEHAGMQELNDWIAAWHASDAYASTRDLFLKRFNAFRSGPRAQISPYDSLIRAHADTLGWDWHLLAAIMYSESRFHIEARSPRGAAGLMQMMPATAAHYGVTDSLDPEINIEAGARLLGELIRRYYKVGENMTERYKYALAAYNAGEGNILKCIRTAEDLDVDPTRWDNIVGIMPEVPGFSGKQTIAYVREVLATYEEYSEVYPR
jgi:membrane-bound lytic murein transglycosylase F